MDEPSNVIPVVAARSHSDGWKRNVFSSPVRSVKKYWMLVILLSLTNLVTSSMFFGSN